MPPLLDYPNHLARAVVLAAGTSDPILSRMYAAHWAVIPNLGTDLVLPPLLHLLPVHLAGRIVVGISILLPVAGTIAYSRAVFGVYSPWPLASGLVAYNATLLLGFLNFVAAIGIALLLAAGWIAWRERHPARTVALATVGAVALFFCHLMGLLFFFVLIAGHEFEQLWLRRTHWPAVPARLAAPCSFVRRLAWPLPRLAARAAGRQNRIHTPDRQGEATGPSVCQLHPAARHRHGVHGRHISPRLSRQAPLPRLAGQRRGSVADGPALSGRTLGVQGNLLSRHTIRDHVGFPAVRRIAAGRPAAHGRTFRGHRLHTAVRHPHGCRRVRVARARP